MTKIFTFADIPGRFATPAPPGQVFNRPAITSNVHLLSAMAGHAGGEESVVLQKFHQCHPVVQKSDCHFGEIQSAKFFKIEGHRWCVRDDSDSNDV